MTYNEVTLSSLVTSELIVASFCVTSFYRSVGNLTPILVPNLIFHSMDLPRESHFELFWIENGNVVTNFPFLNLITTHKPFSTRVGSCFQ